MVASYDSFNSFIVNWYYAYWGYKMKDAERGAIVIFIIVIIYLIGKYLGWW